MCVLVLWSIFPVFSELFSVNYKQLLRYNRVEFLRLSRPASTLFAGQVSSGLEFMLTDVSASLSEAIINVGNKWHGVHQFTPAMR